jgi:tetraacyldisaccharide 4'-kinase
MMKFWYNKDYKSTVFALALWPLALFYRIVILIRRSCYKHGLFKTHNFPAPIIVVGNITVGGTGKTPLVIWLTNFLQKNGYTPGIVSRGYGKKTSTLQIVTPNSQPKQVGDEALVIAEHTHCPMVVGKNRVAAVQQLLAIAPTCNIIISDDGLQHYALGRNIEIAVIDSTRNLGNGFCLPAGPLRETATRLQTVDFVIHNITSDTKKTLPPYQHTMQLIPVCFCQVKNSDHKLALDFFSAQQLPIHAVAGIGNPTRFLQQLRQLEIKIIEHIFPDHYAYQAKDFAFTNDGLPVIMTEKDAVKCKNFAQENWWYLRVNAQVDDAFANTLLNKVE